MRNQTVFDFPVYSTQGGGLAKKLRSEPVFIESPEDFPDLEVGDFVPAEWELVCVTTYSEQLNGYVLN